MATGEVERVRRRLEELEAVQGKRGAAREAATRPYRLAVGDADAARRSSTQTVGASAELLLLDESGHEVARRPIPACALKALTAGRQAFSSVGDFDEHVSAALGQAAFDRLCGKLAARQRASRDVQDVLEREGFSRQQTSSAVGRAARCGILDDGRFAESFVASKTQAGWGRARIARELARWGLSLDDAGDEARQGCSDEQEYARALAAAKKKRIAEKNPVEKLARFLAGRGFSSSVALKVAKEVVAQSQADGVAEVEEM